ncbi:unnamed protein product [Notodromas monacha]|uniref:Uncharacterized protein n=1 Tax=Notodromas monacha TaxID=399045 RepID=A0A7R9BTQ6_9CRUS|nr:unnamed protein product [Notodromas monacha]CAG0920511.1 unnamed protein product [Notodromas monacha]
MDSRGGSYRQDRHDPRHGEKARTWRRIYWQQADDEMPGFWVLVGKITALFEGELGTKGGKKTAAKPRIERRNTGSDFKYLTK